jgi:hypothetical protein
VSEQSDAEAGDSRALVPGTLRGYRTWRIASRLERVPNGMLPITSVTRRDVMWTATMHASCAPLDVVTSTRGHAPETVDHSAPRHDCKCGIYAWYDPSDTAMLNARVFGAIEASGLVLMCDRGFRAERTRVTAVVTRKPRVAAACERAGIAVYRNRRDLLRDHPPEDVAALLGPAPEPEPDPPAPLDGFDRTLMLAIWVRTALLVLAPLALPVVAVLLVAAVAELALLSFVLTRLHP